MSTTLRRGLLKVLHACGVRSMVSTSGLGHPFVCHLGDFFGEYPFYNRYAFVPELELCAAWLRGERGPVVFDVGANVGFWATQLAQMIDANAMIFAFEPVPETFCKLSRSVERLALGARVSPIGAAIAERARVVRLSVASEASGFAQVTDGRLNPRVGNRIAHSVAISLDEFVAGAGVRPALVKIDVEGSEVRVLEGARSLLKSADRPALLFEFNPLTLGELGASKTAFTDLLSDYALYYVDDFEGQRNEFGSSIRDLSDLSWVCNVFAVPRTAESQARFSEAKAGAWAQIRKRQ